MNLKKLLIVGVFLLSYLNNFSQEAAPTLSAGSGTVAFNKGSLDVELITKIIKEKQKEITKEGIKKLIFKAIGNAQLDDYSQFYIERITEILFQEKNHKVMTKRILEESTNYLFVIGITKLITESKSTELKQLFEDGEIYTNYKDTLNVYSINKNNLSKKFSEIDFDERNQLIKTILTICNEVPIIKKLGLLNNYNYYEHEKIYNTTFKNINDYVKLFTNENFILKFKTIIEDIQIKKYLKEIEILLESKKEDAITENSKLDKLTITTENLTKKINSILDLENEINKELIKKLIKQKVFTESKLKAFKKFIDIKNFIENLLAKSNLLKDILNKSGVDFNKIKTQSFENILNEYEANMNNYAYDDMVFKFVAKIDKKDPKIDKIIDSIVKSITQTTAIDGNLKKIDYNKIANYKSLIENKISDFKNNVNENTGNLNELFTTLKELKTNIQVNRFYQTNKPNYFNGVNIDTINANAEKNKKLLKEKLERKGDSIKISKLEKFLKENKNQIEIKKINFKENTALQAVTNYKHKEQKIYKNIISKIEINKESINTYYENIQNIIENYGIVRDYYNLLKFYSEKYEDFINRDSVKITIEDNQFLKKDKNILS